jgi:hypothetical protein
MRARYLHALLLSAQRRLSVSPRLRQLSEFFMQALAPRFIDAAEAHRLRVESGWYGSKPSGTFVTGPHPTEEDCARTLAAQKKK